jgi:hypothetical protein
LFLRPSLEIAVNFSIVNFQIFKGCDSFSTQFWNAVNESYSDYAESIKEVVAVMTVEANQQLPDLLNMPVEILIEYFRPIADCIKLKKEEMYKMFGSIF